MTTFGEQLRAARLKRDLTQGALAAASGVSIDTIRHYEQGSIRMPAVDTAAKLERALGMRFDLAALLEAPDRRKPRAKTAGK